MSRLFECHLSLMLLFGFWISKCSTLNVEKSWIKRPYLDLSCLAYLVWTDQQTNVDTFHGPEISGIYNLIGKLLYILTIRIKECIRNTWSGHSPDILLNVVTCEIYWCFHRHAISFFNIHTWSDGTKLY